MTKWHEEDPGRCPECAIPWEHVRPGKSQPVCECWRQCATHGPESITYYGDWEVPGNISGYICWQCQYPDIPKRKHESNV